MKENKIENKSDRGCLIPRRFYKIKEESLANIKKNEKNMKKRTTKTKELVPQKRASESGWKSIKRLIKGKFSDIWQLIMNR
jgi:hypothetical protein